MSSITKSIQKEYVLLMENAFSEKYKSAFRNLELKELRRFILKEIISSPELDNQLTNLIVLLNKFWDTHAAALITEIRASKSYRLLLPIQRFQKILTNKELLKKLLDNFNNIEKEVWVYDTDLKSFTTREVDLLDYDLPSAIATLLGKVEGAIYAQRSTQLSATLLGIDPVIYSNHMFLHEWTTEQLVKDYGKLNPLSSEEQAITMGLSAAEVKFLTALSDLELKKIRERGQLESLRHELRISRHYLQGKAPDQIQDAADNFSKHLINVVEEYGKSHETAIKNSKKKKISSGLIFAGTATLGIASLAMPQLTLLSAAATGIGLAFGGKSLADIFSEHKAHKNEIQILEKTPVSLLYGAYKKK
ncbi:hypothetical protein SD492_000084 [Salmonella enterica]|nr:hypothetical protein [Salmonella enterica]ECE6008604.1 hypothetical protein [Salmonella enterica subsp. salamae]EAW0069438.1 hypothetical protein [Salmonella enterica]EBN1520555.1 hypothetical protein [Salmonella enterica]ECG1001684.1 hypothetical protein [Salmonella enterica subsp. salamae]